MGYSIDVIDSKNNKIVTTKNKEFVNLYDIPPVSNISVNYEKLKNNEIVPLEIHEFHFDVTYNYYKLFIKCFKNRRGIRSLYNKNIDYCIEKLNIAIDYLLNKYSVVFYKDIYGADPKYKNEYGQYTTRSKTELSIKKLKKCCNINDYWAITPYNVYKYLTYMLYCLHWIKMSYPKKYKKFIIVGD